MVTTQLHADEAKGNGLLTWDGQLLHEEDLAQEKHHPYYDVLPLNDQLLLLVSHLYFAYI